jgi:hypothetical protein
LGELTALVPFELVDAVFQETCNVQRRLRALPSRAGVYFLLAMCLFPEVGYLLVRQKLTASLATLPVVTPTAKALRDLRRRVGSAPMQRLFEVLSGPLAQPTTPGVRFGTYRTVSFDGCSSLKAPDTIRNQVWLGSPGHGGYPLLELMTLVETDRLDEALVVQVLHGAPLAVDITEGLVDQVQVEVVQAELAQRGVEGALGVILAGVLDPQLGGDEQVLARDAAPLDRAADRFLVAVGGGGAGLRRHPHRRRRRSRLPGRQAHLGPTRPRRTATPHR